MEPIPDLAINAFERENGEVVLHGWRAIQMTRRPSRTFRQEFDRGWWSDSLSLDMKGYLFLTDRRLVFVRERMTDHRFEEIPKLECRLEALTTVGTADRSLDLGRLAFRILGVEISLVQQEIQAAIRTVRAYREPPSEPPRYDLGSRPVPRTAPPPPSPAQKPRVALVPCPKCHVLNPADLERCDACGVPL